MRLVINYPQHNISGLTLGITTFSIMTLIITAFSKTTLILTTIGIKHDRNQYKDIQHDDTHRNDI